MNDIMNRDLLVEKAANVFFKEWLSKFEPGCILATLGATCL